jgi:hypothetical protein
MKLGYVLLFLFLTRGEQETESLPGPSAPNVTRDHVFLPSNPTTMCVTVTEDVKTIPKEQVSFLDFNKLLR